MGVTVHGLTELLDDLQHARAEIVPEVKKVVGQGCLNIKKDAQKRIRAAGHRGYLPHYPYAITYNVRQVGQSVVGEVGPESGRLQGGLGALLEYGSRNNAPIPHLGPALDAEEPNFIRYLEELEVRLLEGR